MQLLRLPEYMIEFIHVNLKIRGISHTLVVKVY